jgi:hypothetical protein
MVAAIHLQESHCCLEELQYGPQVHACLLPGNTHNGKTMHTRLSRPLGHLYAKSTDTAVLHQMHTKWDCRLHGKDCCPWELTIVIDC